MKKYLFCIFAVSVVCAVQAANPGLRVNVNGISDKVELTSQEEPCVNVSRMTWLKEDIRPFTLVYDVDRVLAAKWETFEIVFSPKTSGKVHIGISGQYARTPENRKWIVVQGIKCNGKAVWNSNFAQLAPSGCPLGFTFNKKARFLPEGDENKTGAVLVNHDNSVSFQFNVEAGKTYAFSFKVRAAATAEVQ